LHRRFEELVPVVEIRCDVIQSVQLVQLNALAESENLPDEQLPHARSAELVPPVVTRCPATQFVHGLHANALAVTEYFPVAQLLH
jgi:hypothetical protein